MPSFEIWSEGFSATGNSGTAQRWGNAVGRTFKEACLEYSRGDANFDNYFNLNRLTFWGCKLYPSEEEARKSFG